jgi:hypothetical protein
MSRRNFIKIAAVAGIGVPIVGILMGVISGCDVGGMEKQLKNLVHQSAWWQATLKHRCQN